MRKLASDIIRDLETRVAKLERQASLDMMTEVEIISDINDVYGEDFDTDTDVSVVKSATSMGDKIFLCEVSGEDYFAIVIVPSSGSRRGEQEVKSVYSRKSDAMKDFKNLSR